VIHFAHPVRETSLCGAVGDVRWMGISVAKAKACPNCWRLRKRMAGTMKALAGNKRMQEERENRAVRAREKAREAKSAPKPHPQPEQFNLFNNRPC